MCPLQPLNGLVGFPLFQIERAQIRKVIETLRIASSRFPFRKAFIASPTSFFARFVVLCSNLAAEINPLFTGCFLSPSTIVRSPPVELCKSCE